jgi:dATP pyrophosphohydrolase
MKDQSLCGFAASRKKSGPETAMSRFKRPESVLVVIYTQAGEFLLLRRTEPRQFWQSVTGSLRPAESPRQAACREVREETGLWPSAGLLVDLHHTQRFPILPAWRARYAPGTRWNLEHWFALLLPGRRLIRLSPEEHAACRWLPAARAAAVATSWTNRDAILAIAAQWGGRF